MFANYSTEKGLIYRIHEEHIQLNSKQSIANKWTNDLGGHFAKEEIDKTNKYMKKCLISITSRNVCKQNCSEISSYPS